ncbi:MAG TPA: hypothetical protein DDX98_01380 [Bacteroidales bacterium]|nr:hypothetical protein [Bacteroidales bacterium]
MKLKIPLRMKVMRIVIIVALFSTYQLSGQDFPDILPVSPSAYEFLKYEETSVDEYSGKANVSIPLYEI